MFGICYQVNGCPDVSIIHWCGSGFIPGASGVLVQSRYDNGQCAGPASDYVKTDTCYSRPFGQRWQKEQCGYDGTRRRKWYKYQCFVGRLNAAAAEEEGIGDVDAVSV